MKDTPSHRNATGRKSRGPLHSGSAPVISLLSGRQGKDRGRQFFRKVLLAHDHLEIQSLKLLRKIVQQPMIGIVCGALFST